MVGEVTLRQTFWPLSNFFFLTFASYLPFLSWSRGILIFHFPSLFDLSVPSLTLLPLCFADQLDLAALDALPLLRAELSLEGATTRLPFSLRLPPWSSRGLAYARSGATSRSAACPRRSARGRRRGWAPRGRRRRRRCARWGGRRDRRRRRPCGCSSGGGRRGCGRRGGRRTRCRSTSRSRRRGGARP